MKHSEFLERTQLDRRELVGLGHQTLVEDPPRGFIRLPLPPFMVLGGIVNVERIGRGGRVVGEQVVRFDDWFFQGHFLGDPVMPGCLILDTAWMVVGLFAGLGGALGQPRALGCGSLVFHDQVRPDAGVVTYDATIRRMMRVDGGATVVLGDVAVSIAGRRVCDVSDARFGLFPGVAYASYPMGPSGGPTS